LDYAIKAELPQGQLSGFDLAGIDHYNPSQEGAGADKLVRDANKIYQEPIAAPAARL
jgi:hypothetical protein